MAIAIWKFSKFFQGSKSNQFIIGEITVKQYHQIEKTKQKQTTGEKKIYT